MKVVMLKGGKIKGDIVPNNKNGMNYLIFTVPYKTKKNNEYITSYFDITLCFTNEVKTLYKDILLKDNFINVTGHLVSKYRNGKILIVVYPQMISDANGFGNGVWMVNIDNCLLLKDPIPNNYSAFTTAFIKKIAKGKNPKDEAISLNFNVAKSKHLKKGHTVDVWGIYHWEFNQKDDKKYLNQKVDVVHFEYSPFKTSEKKSDNIITSTTNNTTLNNADNKIVKNESKKEELTLVDTTPKVNIEDSPFNNFMHNLF